MHAVLGLLPHDRPVTLDDLVSEILAVATVTARQNREESRRPCSIMTLSETARDRLSDIVELQPTKNSELGDRWGLEDGSAVHQYLEEELGDYYYRDEESRIRATPAAISLVGGTPETLHVQSLQVHITDVLAGPTEEPMSVVATLHALRERGFDPDVDEVRSGLHALEDRGIVELVRKTVPTFRLASPRAEIDIKALEDAGVEA